MNVFNQTIHLESLNKEIVFLEGKKFLLNSICRNYLESTRFNGTPAAEVCGIQSNGSFDFESNPLAVNLSKVPGIENRNHSLMTLEELIKSGQIEVVVDDNPHIKRFPVEMSTEEQIELLRDNISTACLYPSKSNLNKCYIPTDYEHMSAPFTRMLYLGEAQFKPLFFDLGVLENYSEDPKYLFQFKDYFGEISLSDQYYFSKEVKPRDKNFLKRFGIGYKKSNGMRVAVACVYDLHLLTPEHQEIWKSSMIDDEECFVDEDYIRYLHGAYPKSRSIYLGIIEEIAQINNLCGVIGWPKMFKKDFKEQRLPYFRIPFRATKEAYLKSISELDKMLSQNINDKFFSVVLKDHKTYSIEKHKATGMYSVKDWGTMKLMKYFTTSCYNFDNPDGRKMYLSALDCLSEIRKVRQKPAHEIVTNELGIDFLKKHDRMVKGAFEWVSSVRIMLQNHPKVTDEVKSKIPEWIRECNIRQYVRYELKNTLVD